MSGAQIGGIDLATAVFLLGAAVGTVFALAFIILVVKGFLYICRPNEILIFAGRPMHHRERAALPRSG